MLVSFALHHGELTRKRQCNYSLRPSSHSVIVSPQLSMHFRQAGLPPPTLRQNWQSDFLNPRRPISRLHVPLSHSESSRPLERAASTHASFSTWVIRISKRLSFCPRMTCSMLSS